MAYETNRFCWFGLISSNTKQSQDFYSSVIGWEVQTMSMGDDVAIMFAASSIPFAHIGEAKGAPDHWSCFLRVDDVDASTKAAVANGGKELMAAKDIPPGRFSVVASPTGGAFCLFHEADPADKHHPGGELSVNWTEMHSTDPKVDGKWLAETFGVGLSDMPGPGGGTYTLLNPSPAGNGDPMVKASGGLTSSMMKGARSCWVNWVLVPDCDGVLKRATEKGGEVLMPKTDGGDMGFMGMFKDPLGAVVGVIQSKS